MKKNKEDTLLKKWMLLIIRSAFLPIQMLPVMFCSSIAQAPLNVAALTASSGNIFIPIHASEMIKFIL